MTYRTILVAALAVSGLSACVGTSGAGVMPTHRMHPVTVAESVERLELYSRPDGLTLSARDQSAVNEFLAVYAANGTGPLFINRPAGHAAGLGVQETDRMLRASMARVGLNPSATQTGEYHVRPGDPAPVVVSYKTLRTVPQDCSHTPNFGRVATNGVSSNFGCFASANMAAMIQDPRQLIEPLPQGTPNAQRRQVIYDAYIEGSTTAAQRPQGQMVDSQSAG